MIQASQALINLLNSEEEFRMADLFTFLLPNGVTLRYTSADIDIVSGGNVFSSVGPQIVRGSIRLSTGIEVDTLDVTVYSDRNDVISNGLSLSQLLTVGGFDNAWFKLERAFMPTWGDTSVGTVLRFLGKVAEADYSRTKAEIKIKSLLELLNIKMPRNLFQPGCIYNLFDVGCKLSKTAWKVNGTVSAGSAANLIKSSNLTQGNGYFDLGLIVFNTGLNTGIGRTVKLYTTGQVRPIIPFPQVPKAGDTFSIYPGCDKKQATCKNKFNNLAHFRGFPFVPMPETIV